MMQNNLRTFFLFFQGILKWHFLTVSGPKIAFHKIIQCKMGLKNLMLNLTSLNFMEPWRVLMKTNTNNGTPSIRPLASSEALFYLWEKKGKEKEKNRLHGYSTGVGREVKSKLSVYLAIYLEIAAASCSPSSSSSCTFFFLPSLCRILSSLCIPHRPPTYRRRRKIGGKPATLPIVFSQSSKKVRNLTSK